MHQFFALPLNEKQLVKRSKDNSRGFADDEFTKQTRDSKQLFDVGGNNESVQQVLDGLNQWPSSSSLPQFRSTLEN